MVHARSIGMDPADDRVGAIHDSYNGLIDPFVNGFSWRAITDHSRGRTPGKNDALDMAHMLYLTSDAALVTGDRAMSETASAAGVKVLSRDALTAVVANNR
jgi:hypothetical protein